MHPNISEFSYGYALTETLVTASPVPIRAAPVFPSLIEEGKKGGGYDVSIPFKGFPLFLQFKLSHHMVRASAFESQQGLLSTPFYRMHLRPTKHSQQHPMLLDLDASGAAVYYAAPRFHEPAELNKAYIETQVINRSIFVRPSAIGALDDGDHHLSFKNGSPIYLCSHEPRIIQEPDPKQRHFWDDIAQGPDRFESLTPSDDGVRQWNERLLGIVRKHRYAIGGIAERDLDALQNRAPTRQFTYLARTFFGCDVILIAPGRETQHRENAP